MTASRDAAALLDAYRAGTLAIEFALDTANQAAFEGDLKTQAAVLHQLMVLGEAVKRLSPAFRLQHPSIPWRQMAGLRDVLIHAYDEVSLDAVWRVVADDLPPVLAAIEPILPKKPGP